MFQVENETERLTEFQMKRLPMRLERHSGAKDMQFSDDMLQMLALRVTADFQSKIKDGKFP